MTNYGLSIRQGPTLRQLLGISKPKKEINYYDRFYKQTTARTAQTRNLGKFANTVRQQAGILTENTFLVPDVLYKLTKRTQTDITKTELSAKDEFEYMTNWARVFEQLY
jgi:hypothetical protein